MLNCTACCRLSLNTAGSSPHGYSTPLQQELGGFDFETGSAALETPTFSTTYTREGPGGGLGGGGISRRLTGEGGISSNSRRRTTRNQGAAEQSLLHRCVCSAARPREGLQLASSSGASPQCSTRFEGYVVDFRAVAGTAQQHCQQSSYLLQLLLGNTRHTCDAGGVRSCSRSSRPHLGTLLSNLRDLTPSTPAAACC